MQERPLAHSIDCLHTAPEPFNIVQVPVPVAVTEQYNPDWQIPVAPKQGCPAGFDVTHLMGAAEKSQPEPVGLLAGQIFVSEHGVLVAPDKLVGIVLQTPA